MNCIQLYEQFSRNEICYDLFIQKVKGLYQYRPMSIPPDEITILSSCAIIAHLNNPSEKMEYGNLIALARKVLRETGDADAVRLLLSCTLASGSTLRRILRNPSFYCLLDYLRPELLYTKLPANHPARRSR